MNFEQFHRLSSDLWKPQIIQFQFNSFLCKIEAHWSEMNALLNSKVFWPKLIKILNELLVRLTKNLNKVSGHKV